jgi:hypothetical protein
MRPLFNDWTIPRQLWRTVRPLLFPRMPTLETGSGLSTLLFEAAGCRHTALEHDETMAAPSECVVLAPLAGDPPWYDWRPRHAYDLILIDGPPKGSGGRHGILRVFGDLIHPATVVVLDDTHRRAERQLAQAICQKYRFRAEFHTSDNRGFALLTPCK